MESVDYLMAFRRRWGILVIAVVVALGAGYASKSLAKSGNTTTITDYTASAVLLGSSDPAVTNLATLSWLARVGPVPVRVARVLNWPGQPYELAGGLQVTQDQGAGLMWIGATASTPGRAQLIANTFAKELIQYLAGSRSRGAVEQASHLKTQMDQLGRAISSLNVQIAGSYGTAATLLTAQRDAKIRAYGVLSDQYAQLAQSSFQGAPISLIQYAHATPNVSSSSSVSLPVRLAVAALLGLFAGAGLVLVLDRFDQRIRTKKEAERAFRLPVLGEIPVLSRRERDSISMEHLRPFRLLGAVVTSPSSELGTAGNGDRPSDLRTILVTSASRAEGKTTLVGYLAAAFAEEGKKVMVLSCDLRRPDVHRLFELPDDPGLLKALNANRGLGALNGHARRTTFPNIRVVASEPAPEQVGALLSSDAMKRVLEEARQEADVVLVDTSSLLEDGDPAVLTSMVDRVLIVAEAGKTTSDDAKTTAEFLTRLGAPVVGVAMNRVRNA